MEDALSATRAAVEEGIVPGGGTVLIRASAALDNVSSDNDDEQTGIDVLKRALLAPIRVIAANSGYEGAVILAKVADSTVKNYGFDAHKGEYGDMVKMGIIDPAKVTRAAVENAVSVAGMILTTEALISEKDDPMPAMPGGPPGGGDMGF
jgi:chaperonin GroEL